MKYMPMGYFNAQSLGSLTAVATSTMEDLESMSFAVIARTVVGMIRTTIFSLAVLCFDWRIGLIFLLGMLLFLWVNSLLLKKSRELSPGRLAAQTLSLIHIYMFTRLPLFSTPDGRQFWGSDPQNFCAIVSIY